MQELSYKFDGKYSEDTPRSINTPHGAIKSQKVYCEIQHNQHRIKLIGNYQLGADILFVEDDPVYSMFLSVPYKIKPIHFHLRSKWSKLFRVGVKNEILKKYSVKTNTQTEKLLRSAKFEYLMLTYNVFINTEVRNDETVISLHAYQPIGELSELEELLEIVTLISNEIK